MSFVQQETNQRFERAVGEFIIETGRMRGMRQSALSLKGVHNDIKTALRHLGEILGAMMKVCVA